MMPNRLAGATLMTPVTNYWWPAFPSNLSTQAYYKQPVQDQWAVRVAHYFPWLTYWWITQKWFPSSSVVQRNPAVFSQQDLSILSKLTNREYQVPTFMHFIFFPLLSPCLVNTIVFPLNSKTPKYFSLPSF